MVSFRSSAVCGLPVSLPLSFSTFSWMILCQLFFLFVFTPYFTDGALAKTGIASTTSPNPAIKTAISSVTTSPGQRPVHKNLSPLRPPFPNGPCGGTVVEIPPSETYAVDTHLNGNTLVLPPRTIKVWLPPGFPQRGKKASTNASSSLSKSPPTPSTQTWTTLYCHDGQNAMTDSDSWTGNSWRLMGALTRLMERDLLTVNPSNLIVVMIPSASEQWLGGTVRRRHLEYADGGLAQEAHAHFVAKTLVPYIDNRFWGSTGTTDTTGSAPTHERYLMGSSMGGLASLQLLLEHPDLFSGAACLSPYFTPLSVQSVAEKGESIRDKRVYMDIGGDMGETRVPFLDLLDHVAASELRFQNPGYFWLDTQLQPTVSAMKTVMKQKGFSDMLYHEEPGGRHNERAWAQRIDLPLLHLFGKRYAD